MFKSKLDRLGLTPINAKMDWSKVDAFAYDGVFRGTVEQLMPIMRRFLRAKVKPTEFPSGSGYTLSGGVNGQTATMRPAKKDPKLTVIEVNLDAFGEKHWKQLLDAFGKHRDDFELFNGWYITSVKNVSQAKWNKTVRPLFDNGWKAKVIPHVNIQQIKRKSVVANYDPETKTVTLTYYKDDE
jgi:hypothetical protein